MSTSAETNSTQVFPQEILDNIIQHAFEPWPTSFQPYDAAVKSRVNSPFLLVNKFCRQAVQKELSETLWLEFKRPDLRPLWKRSPGQTFYSPFHPHDADFKPDLSLTVLKNNSELVSVRVNRGMPFTYGGLRHIISFYVFGSRGDATLYLETDHLTYRATKIVDEEVRPMLEFLLNVHPVSSPWENLANRIKMPFFGRLELEEGVSCFDLLESAVLACRHYYKLRSQSLLAEAESFILCADSSLVRRYDASRSILDLTWAIEAFSDSTQRTNELHVCMMQCHKMLLEIAILTDSIRLRRMHSEPSHYRYTLPRPKCFGLSDLDRARFYLSQGIISLRRHAFEHPGRSDGIYSIQTANSYLALAMAMFSNNESWKQEITSSMNLNREMNSEVFADDLDMSLPPICQWTDNQGASSRDSPQKHQYIDSEGISREYIGCLRIDAWSHSFESLELLPMLQRFSLSCVASLEKRLGIENGKWWSSCKDADVDGLNVGQERVSTSE